MVTSLEGFRSFIVVTLGLQTKGDAGLLTVLYFPFSVEDASASVKAASVIFRCSPGTAAGWRLGQQ
jgi:hypothetical protein